MFDLCFFQQISNESRPIGLRESEVDIEEPAQVAGGIKLAPVECFDRVRQLGTVYRQHEYDVVCLEKMLCGLDERNRIGWRHLSSSSITTMSGCFVD